MSETVHDWQYVSLNFYPAVGLTTFHYLYEIALVEQNN